MNILVSLFESIIVSIIFLSFFVIVSAIRGLFRSKEEFNTPWKRFFNNGKPFTLGGAVLFIWGLLGVAGVLLNYSFDKQHGIPTYFTDATIIYGYLPSLVLAVVGLIANRYFKYLRHKKSQENAVETISVAEKPAIKTSHKVAVKVRTSPTVSVVNTTTDNTAPANPAPNGKKRFCKYCGGEIDPSAKKCLSCGKQFFHFSKTKVLVSIIALLIVVGVGGFCGYKAYTKAVNEEIFSYAMDALNNQQFSLALSYLDQLPSPETKYPDEYAYAKAGVLYEEEDYLAAYNAFNSLENPPTEIIKNLRSRIYSEGKKAYNSHHIQTAKRYFSAIPDHAGSTDYLLLIKIKSTGIVTKEEYAKLVDNFYLEDVKNIIMTYSDSALLFLEGYWETSSGEYFMEIDSDGTIYTNLLGVYSYWIGSLGQYTNYFWSPLNFNVITQDSINVGVLEKNRYINPGYFTFFRQNSN